MSLQQAEQNGSKDSPIGKLPTEWDVVTVDKIAKITTGNKDTQDRDDSAPYPFFVRSQNVERINSYSFDGEAVLTAGDGVGTGKVFHYYVGKFDFHQRVYCLHSFSEDVNGYFFYEFFRHNFMKRVAQFSAKGSVDSVRLAMISEMLVPKPPKIEQSKIAEILSTVERAIENTDALIAKQQRIKTGLMQDLLTRGIDEDGNLRSEESHQFKDSIYGRIPESWNVLPAAHLCDAVIDCKNRTPPESEAGYHVVKTTNVKNGRLVTDTMTFTDARSYETWTSRGKPVPGNILITREAPIGEAGIVTEDMPPLCLGQRMTMYKLDRTKVSPEFLLFTLLSRPVQEMLVSKAGGSTVGHVRVGDIKFLPVLICSLKEQRRIASILSSIHQQIYDSQVALAKLQRQKNALMQDLLTGEKRVTPLLEPAVSR
jgi:type I restriction enzyme S subunit